MGFKGATLNGEYGFKIGRPGTERRQKMFKKSFILRISSTIAYKSMELIMGKSREKQHKDNVFQFF